jgi:hypothetical protein
MFFRRAAVEPIRAPDSMNPPAAGFQYLLPDAVAIARGARRVIRGAVAFDPEKVASLVFRT